jgi:hypothetical protein
LTFPLEDDAIGVRADKVLKLVEKVFAGAGLADPDIVFVGDIGYILGGVVCFQVAVVSGEVGVIAPGVERFAGAGGG